MLTFDRLVTGPIVHVIYWCGLCLILLFGFAWIGGSIGLALRSMSLEILLIAIPAVVAGLLIMSALALLWRGMCEFYVAVFRIAEDLHALRASNERETVAAAVRGAADRRMEL
jgi:hypothetical protein